MKSTLKNMVVVLFTITLISSAAVGGVYMLTKGPIEQAKAAVENSARQNVLPEGEYTLVKADTLLVDGLQVVVSHMLRGGDSAPYYAVKSLTNNGYGGQIALMVGFDAEATVQNIEVLESKETPGLGSKLSLNDTVKNPVRHDVVGRKMDNKGLKVRKDGGDVDALTAATISSRAYLDAVERAHKALVQSLSPSDDAEDMNKTTEGGYDGE